MKAAEMGKTCPFCNEQDFDLVGLKSHLRHDCLPYQETGVLPRRFAPFNPTQPPAHIAAHKYIDNGRNACAVCGDEWLDSRHRLIDPTR